MCGQICRNVPKKDDTQLYLTDIKNTVKGITCNKTIHFTHGEYIADNGSVKFSMVPCTIDAFNAKYCRNLTSSEKYGWAVTEESITGFTTWIPRTDVDKLKLLGIS